MEVLKWSGLVEIWTYTQFDLWYDLKQAVILMSSRVSAVE